MKSIVKKKRRRFLLRRKRSLDPALIIDYKKPEVLKRFITDRGKIIPRRISGATQAQQRKITLAVKRARFLALIPSAVSHEVEKGFSGEMQGVAQSFAAASLRGRPREGMDPNRARERGPREGREGREGEESEVKTEG